MEEQKNLQQETANLLYARDQSLFDEISFEYGRLMDWFHKDYPEAVIRLDVNADTTTNSISYKLSVLSGKEATPENQLYVDNTHTISRSKFSDPMYMRKFCNSIFPHYQKQITKVMNEHYRTEKEKMDS